MLDAYIIERIRRERDAERDGAFVPLRAPTPEPRPIRRDPSDDDDADRDRGSVVIDFDL